MFCSSIPSLSCVGKFPWTRLHLQRLNRLVSNRHSRSRRFAKHKSVSVISCPLPLSSNRALQADFAKERNWLQFHTPRNLLLALVGEVGELSEIFQWKSDDAVK